MTKMPKFVLAADLKKGDRVRVGVDAITNEDLFAPIESIAAPTGERSTYVVVTAATAQLDSTKRVLNGSDGWDCIQAD
ncbi:MAG: hypothetical protein QM617_04800 [Comamonas sp.]